MKRAGGRIGYANSTRTWREDSLLLERGLYEKAHRGAVDEPPRQAADELHDESTSPPVKRLYTMGVLRLPVSVQTNE
jgi:hypothetical protein